MNKAFIAATILTTSISCSGDGGSNNDEPIIGKSEIIVEKGVLTPEVLYSFGRISDMQLSPDKKTILYGVTYVGIEENKTNRELFTINVDGTNKKQLTHTPQNESSAVWIDGGNKIAYLSSKTGEGQVWVMNTDGSNNKQFSHIEGGIEGFLFSPDETKLLYIKDVPYYGTIEKKYEDLPKSSGRVVNDLMYKHWDHWSESIPRTYVADITPNGLKNEIDLIEGEPYELPILPFGGIEEFSWTPDGQKIAYSCKKKIGQEYAESTNTDIYLFDIASKETINLTEGMMGYDTNPSFSPDGTKLAWLSMERDGYESDKNRLFVMDMSTGIKNYITKSFDYNVNSFVWDENSSGYFISTVEAKTHIFKVNLENNEINAITSGKYDYEACAVVNDDTLVAVRHSLSKPNEIYRVDAVSGDATELTFENQQILEQLTMGEVEERWITTTDGKQMLTWVIYPPNFDPNKKYPALLYLQGGPQSPVSQFWSYRWNPQLMAANDYIIVAPNRRGLPGFGQEWLEQISKDYGGQNMKDYLSAIDELSKEPYVDSDNLGATGASYGGFSTYWLAGNHDKRFKAFFSHAGIFNLEAQYLETEELFFANWDMGGPYWDLNNKDAQKTYATSPHKKIDNWDTPIMISHGEKDYRILASQGMQAFNAAKLKGIPTRMLVYPNENHWIAQPQNGILFQREFFRWFDENLKKDKNLE